METRVCRDRSFWQIELETSDGGILGFSDTGTRKTFQIVARDLTHKY